MTPEEVNNNPHQLDISESKMQVGVDSPEKPTPAQNGKDCMKSRLECSNSCEKALCSCDPQSCEYSKTVEIESLMQSSCASSQFSVQSENYHSKINMVGTQTNSNILSQNDGAMINFKNNATFTSSSLTASLESSKHEMSYKLENVASNSTASCYTKEAKQETNAMESSLAKIESTNSQPPAEQLMSSFQTVDQLAGMEYSTASGISEQNMNTMPSPSVSCKIYENDEREMQLQQTSYISTSSVTQTSFTDLTNEVQFIPEFFAWRLLFHSLFFYLN